MISEAGTEVGEAIEMLLRPHQKSKKRYGRMRAMPYNDRSIAYRTVSGGKGDRLWYCWFICGFVAEDWRVQVGENSRSAKIRVYPVSTSEERNSMRSELGASLHAPIVFAYLV